MEDFERLAKALILRHIFDACSSKNTKTRRVARDFLLGATKEWESSRNAWCYVGKINVQKLKNKVQEWDKNNWPKLKRCYRIEDFI